MKSSELLEEARGINSSLHRARQGLTWSVAQTESASTILRRDGEVITDALNEHKVELRSSLESTRRRLQRIQKSEEYEKIALWSALAFFTVVVCFILMSRFRVFVILYDFLYCSLFASQKDAHGGEL
jgi:hypothetical protein